MVLRVTRRNLLLLMFMLSILGFFVYSKIGAQVNLLKGTSLALNNAKSGAVHNGDKKQGNSLAPKEIQDDDVSGVIRLPHDSAQRIDEMEDEEGGIDDDSTANAKGKAVVLIGNHMRIGDDFNQLMKEEGFIEGVESEAEKTTSIQGKQDHELPQETAVENALPNKEKSKVNTQVMVINERAMVKSDKVKHILKIGWTRDIQKTVEQPVFSQNETRELPPNSAIITSHYFLENPQDVKAKKLYLKCLSKMSLIERKELTEWEFNYKKSEKLSATHLNMGRRWDILKRYMLSLGREQRLPQVINIGAKKSGTTALGWFLSMHPQIAHSFGNEVHFFDKNYHKGIEYYRSRMNFAKQNQLVFEKTPRYLVTESAPGLALKDLPQEVKFIICIRDPVYRALSDFRHDSTLQIRRKYAAERSIIQNRTAESEGVRFASGAFDKYGNVNSSFDSIRTSSYVKHFRNWLSYFPRERFFIVDHHRLVSDVFHELRRLEIFLELTPFFQASMFYYDQSRRGMCVKGRPNPCPPRSSPGFLPSGKLNDVAEQKLRDYFRPLNHEFVKLVGEHNFTWVDL